MQAPVFGAAAAAREYSVFSPDKKIEFKLTAGSDLRYAVNYEGRPLVASSSISMTIDSGGPRILGRGVKVKSEKRRSVDDILKPVVRQKAAAISDRFNELAIRFAGDYALTVRAYDDGVAYRFETSLPGPITVVSEQAEFVFPEILKPGFRRKRASRRTERKFHSVSLSDVTEKRFASCPVVVDPAGGPKVAVTEADLEDYAGMYLAG